MPDVMAVTLRGMRFHVRVGILPHEREIAQPLEIDITAWPRSADRGAPPVDYRDLYACVADAVAAHRLDYLESLAHDVCERTLTRGDVARVAVRVRKPHVALGGALDYAEIALEREATP